MKREYVRPMMVAERFAANEYVAACHDKVSTFEFECNEWPGYVGYVYEETNGREGLQLSEMSNVISGSYSQCGTHHTLTRAEAEKLTLGYVVKYTADSGFLPDYVPVYVWRGKDGQNCHCTKNVEEVISYINLS